MQLLRETLVSNQTALLHCIQYEVLDKRPVFDSYRSFCRKVGPDVMDFITFEFWYMRFYRDQLDLEYTRDKKPLELLGLPIELVDMVIKELDPVDRIVTRQVCKTLQRFVDGQNRSIENIDFQLTADSACLGFDGKLTLYKKVANGCKVKFEGSEFVVENEHFMRTTVKDFSAILNTQERKLENLHFSTSGMSPEDLDVFSSECLSMDEIHVTSMSVGRFGLYTNLEPIWLKLTPRILENAKFAAHFSRELAETEQWIQAKTLDLGYGHLASTVLPNFYTSRNFSVQIHTLWTRDLFQLGTALRQSARFEKCRIRGSTLLVFDRDLAASFGAVSAADRSFRVLIPGTNEYLKYKLDPQCVTIRRKRL